MPASTHSLIILLLFLMFPRPSFGQLLPDITLSGPHSCPSVESVQSRVLELINRESGTGISRIHFDITQRSGDFLIDISLTADDETSRRQLSGESCQSVVEAGIVIVALAIDAWETFQQTESNTVAEPNEQTQVSVEDDQEIESPSRTISGAAATLATFDFGSLPGVGFGVSLGFALDFDRSRVELRGRFLPGKTIEVEHHETARADLWMWMTSLVGCYSPIRRPFEISLCGGFDIGGIQAKSEGIDHPSAGSGLLYGPSLSSAFFYRPVRYFSLRFEGGILLPIEKLSFVINGLGEVHRTAPLAGYLGLGVEVCFP